MTRFTISGVLEGPRDLREQLPVTGRTIDVRSGPDGHTYFCAHLDKPIKYHVAAATPAGSMTEEVDETTDGDAYVLVSEIVMRSTDPAAQPHHGMQRFPVEVAYVTDPSYNDAEELDFAKIVPVAAAEIDGLDEESTLIFSRPALDDESGSGQQDSTLTAGSDTVHHDGFVDDLPTSVGIVLPPSVRPDLEQSGNARPLLPAGADAVELEHATSTEGATGFDHPESAGVLPTDGYSKPALTPLTYAHTGPSKRILAVGAAAAVAIIFVAITVWNSLTTDSAGSGAVGTTTTVAHAPQEADVKRLKASLPKGYSDDSCTTNADEAVPSVTCGPNADAGGPQKAAYAAPPNPQALRSAFNDAIARFGRVACPGNLQSPGPWHRGGKAEGALFCGTAEGQAVIVWTNHARSLLYVVQAGPQAGAPSLDQLYVWWTQHA